MTISAPRCTALATGACLVLLSLVATADDHHLSVADYTGDIVWDGVPDAKAWYQRIKSRPSFRPLLADHVRGITPSANYAELDF